MTSKNVVVSLKNISKSYILYNRYRDKIKHLVFSMFGRQYGNSFQALKDVTLEIYRGDTLGVIGVNGSGKSTLLQIIVGVLQPTYGTIRSKGRITALLELGAGFSPDFTGRENIFLSGAVLGIREKDMIELLPEIVDFAQIGDYIDQPVRYYSSGMYLRLAFSVATSVKPDILVIDEALAVGDVGFINKCMRKMEDLKEAGTTIILVSHDIQAVRNLCEKVLWLDQGEMREYGKTIDTTSKYIQSVYSSNWKFNQQDKQNADDLLVSSMLSENLFEIPSNSDKLIRWGSGEICIVGFEISTNLGRMGQDIEYGVQLKIDLLIQAKVDINSNNLGVGIGILNNKGLSVITITTFDEQEFIPPLMKNQKIKISFDFQNILGPGEYSLSVNIEERSQVVPHYFDYIENIHIFRVTSHKNIYSMVLPKATLRVETVG